MKYVDPWNIAQSQAQKRMDPRAKNQPTRKQHQPHSLHHVILRLKSIDINTLTTTVNRNPLLYLTRLIQVVMLAMQLQG
jgi:hypothetical protein